MDEEQRLIKYYLQQQMTSKVGRKVESRTLRSSRRLRSCDIAEENLPEVGELPCGANFEVEKNQIEPQRQQQMKEKNERDSTSIPNNQNSLLCPSEEKAKRFTRSSAYQWRKVQPDFEIQLDPITPEGQPVAKIQLPATTKKTLKVLFIQPVSECEPADINSLTVKKGTAKPLQAEVSLYNQPRKSYRKIHKREIVSLPYRKCHDIFEGRIVTIINKIQIGKNCSRDLESLVDRMQKISIKDMMNRYIISGIKTIVHFAKEKNIYDATIIRKMETELAKLETRIAEELERTDAFEVAASSMNQNEPDGLEYRGLLIRKIYKILKRKYPQRSLKENREQAIRQCERVLSQDATHANLVKFIKEKMEIAN